MSIHTILAYMKKPSQAYTLATPAHRLVVESEHFHPQGHDVVEGIRHRKFTDMGGMMTGIELMIGYPDAEKAERYLEACQWWLHRAPFGVERLRLSVIVHGHKAFADRGKKYVTFIDDFSPVPCVLVPKVCSTLPQIRELDISFTNAEDLAPLAGLSKLEVLVAVGTPIASVEPLRQLQRLKKVFLSWCATLSSIAAFASMNTLEELDVSCTAISNLDALRECQRLMIVSAAVCKSLSNFDVFEGMENLEELDLSGTRVARVDALGKCKKLRRLDVSNCSALTSLSGLAGAPALEEIDARDNSIANTDGLHQCQRLRIVNVQSCTSLTSLSGLAGAPALELIYAAGSGIVNTDNIHQCQRLRVIGVSHCKGLTSLSGLAGAPALEEIDAKESGVIDLPNSNALSHLQLLDLRGTACERVSCGRLRPPNQWENESAIERDDQSDHPWGAP